LIGYQVTTLSGFACRQSVESEVGHRSCHDRCNPSKVYIGLLTTQPGGKPDPFSRHHVYPTPNSWTIVRWYPLNVPESCATNYPCLHNNVHRPLNVHEGGIVGTVQNCVGTNGLVVLKHIDFLKFNCNGHCLFLACGLAAQSYMPFQGGLPSLSWLHYVGRP